jgi:phosphoglycolate phosphatase-like HAD superfamily hydrolase
MHECPRFARAPEEVELSNIIVFDLDGVITSEEAYWITAGLVLHELLFSPRYWNIQQHCGLEGIGSAQGTIPTAPTGIQGHSGLVGTGSAQGTIPTDYRRPVPEEYEQVAHATLPKEVILKLKGRAINSNWDTCYVATCICLIDLLAKLPDCMDLLPLRPWAEDWMAAFRHALAQIPGPIEITPATFGRLDEPFFEGIIGLELIDRLNGYASHVLGVQIEGVFARYSPSWMLCQDLFQQWYHVGQGTGERGVIHLERPLLPVETLRATLGAVRERGYKLGIATGRQSQEAVSPLKNYGLLEYFDESRITTHKEIALAEEALRERGEVISLVKPHPYQFLLAADPDYLPGQPLPPRGSFIVVGDTPSDVRGGRAANAITVAVLTGAHTAEARMLLEQSQPDFLIEDVTHVPALLDQIDDLATIQRLQFTRRELAELLLQRWFARHMDLCVEQVTLMPKAVSLNSFNGVYRANGEEYFFKTHVEDKGILEEYYHAEMLFNAGYNVVKPLRTLHEKGQQMVIYPVVHDPVLFDLTRAVEMGDTTQAKLDLLVAAERRECERLLAIYEATLASSSAEEHARAPIHQLFWHRLTGERLTNFYAGKRIPFPEGPRRYGVDKELLFEELLGYRWVINGVEVATWKATLLQYPRTDRRNEENRTPLPTSPNAGHSNRTILNRSTGFTLGELLEQARVTLHPAREMYTVIGHGDAHFGNVFLEDQKYYKYFDPAFAGRHAPLLDIVKPFFHNVFAMWMYFPDEIARQLQITVDISGDTIFVEHNYVLSAIRQAIWETKTAYLLKPLLALLREHDALPSDWFDVWRLAMVCCPLLTVNLLDATRRPASICWLGLAQAVQMGNLEDI